MSPGVWKSGVLGTDWKNWSPSVENMDGKVWCTWKIREPTGHAEDTRYGSRGRRAEKWDNHQSQMMAAKIWANGESKVNYASK